MPTKKEIEDLENALNAQREMTADSLEKLGFNNKPRHNSGASGVFDLDSEHAAEDASATRQKIHAEGVAQVEQVPGATINALGFEFIGVRAFDWSPYA